MDWYIAQKDERKGPFEEPEFRKLLESGELKPEDLVWHRGLTGWMRAEEVPGLFFPPPVSGDSPEGEVPVDREFTVEVAEKGDVEKPYEVESNTSDGLRPPPLNDRIRSYFVRHWRGELSLGVSYWINWFLLSAVFTGVSKTLLTLIDPTTNPTFYCFAAISFWAVIFTLSLWQAVGLWRASVNHIKKHHRFFWARVAQGLVFVGVIVSLYSLFFAALPQVNEYAKIALRADNYGRYEIRTLRHGTEMEVSGAIAFGLTEEVKKQLDANPGIRVIHLNSIGGRIVEGRKLRDLIASRKLTTYSSQGCLSACTDAFIGGTVRVLHKNAKLGFHQPSFPGVNHDQLQSSIESEKQLFLSAGIDRNFVEKAMSTPKDDMWVPSTYELLQAKVITRVSDGSDFGISGADARADSKQIESWLLEIPVYQKLKEYCPEIYEQILTDFLNSAKSGDSKSELIAKVRTKMKTVIQKSLPRATDDALIEWVEVMIRELQQLGNESGDLCFAYIVPAQSGDVDYMNHFPKELSEAELNANAKIIQTASTTPQPIPSEAQVSKHLEYVMSVLAQRHGKDISVLANVNLPTVDKSKVCELSIELYQD